MAEQHELRSAAERLFSGENKDQQDLDMLTEFIDKTFEEKGKERWIPTLEDRPDYGKKVWCAVVDHDLTRHVCRGDYGFHTGWNLDLRNVKVLKITHWKESLPLPKLPPLQIKEDI